MSKGDIKNLRKSLGMTQMAFAQHIGVSFMTVNRWEAGATAPNPLAVKILKSIIKKCKGGDAHK